MSKDQERKLFLFLLKENGQNILVSELEEEVYFKVLISNEKLGHYQNYRRSRTILMANMNRFTERLSSVMKNMIQTQSIPTRPVQEHLLRDMSSELFNVLSSFYAFLDFVETWMKRNFESKQKDFKKLTNKFFDKYFEYRFFYKLRNYVVHLGVPIEIVREMSTQDDKLHLMISLSVQSLLDNYDSWGKVKIDLEKKVDDGMILLPTTYFNFAKMLIKFLKLVDSLINEYAEVDAKFLHSFVEKENLDSDVLFVHEQLKIPDTNGNLSYEIPINSLVIMDILNQESDRRTYYPIPI